MPSPSKYTLQALAHDGRSNMHKFTKQEMAELVDLFHLARTALAGSGARVTRYDQKLWASKEFAKKHPEVSSTAAYKALCREEAWRF